MTAGCPSASFGKRGLPGRHVDYMNTPGSSGILCLSRPGLSPLETAPKVRSEAFRLRLSEAERISSPSHVPRLGNGLGHGLRPNRLAEQAQRQNVTPTPVRISGT